MKCRHCREELNNIFLDLGFAPPSNAYLLDDDLTKPEKYLPLKIMVCNLCWLVQTCDFVNADELFDENYAYLSSISSSWVRHANDYVEQITEKLKLNQKSFVIEIASNDGYLLQNFVRKKIPCLGIEPTLSTAMVAKEKGIPVISKFFGEEFAKILSADHGKADLIIGNNVYAHVPDINDFTSGIKVLLSQNGVVTLEFPHLMQLIEEVQFDTIYHEHFSYLSLGVVIDIFKKFGLKVWDVEILKTHGGSIRVYGAHSDSYFEVSQNVQDLLDKEFKAGLKNINGYSGFQDRVDKIKNELLLFLINQKLNNKKVIGYGAAAKGNTFLNYAGIKSDLISYVCDAAQSKKNKLLPGSHLKILDPEVLETDSPDYILILPWNLIDELTPLLRKFNGSRSSKLVTAIPQIMIYE